MTTKHYGKKRDAALTLWVKLARAFATFSKASDRDIERYGLTTAQFGALECLGHLGPMTIGALCRKQLVSGGNMTVVVDNLAKLDLVERVHSKEDRRSIVVQLTGKGKKHFQEIFPQHAKHIALLTSALTEKEHEQLGRLLKKLGLSLVDRPRNSALGGAMRWNITKQLLYINNSREKCFMKRILFGLFVFVVATMNGQTAWKLDKAHSQVNFMVSHLAFSEVTGTFKDFDATLESTKADLSDATIEASIKTGSLDTQNEGRDKHVKSDDFLNVEKYPTITFKSTNFEKTGADTYKITGDLTIRDVTKSVVLDAKYKGPINDPWGNTRIAFKATATVDRFEFGVKWNKLIEGGGLVAGKDVNIILLMEFSKPKAG